MYCVIEVFLDKADVPGMRVASVKIYNSYDNALSECNKLCKVWGYKKSPYFIDTWTNEVNPNKVALVSIKNSSVYDEND